MEFSAEGSTPVAVGAKKEEKQQMHMMKASEKRPIRLPVGEALTLRSRTKEISPSSSMAAAEFWSWNWIS